MKQSSNGKFNFKFHVYFVIYFAPWSQAERCSADNEKTRLYIDIHMYNIKYQEQTGIPVRFGSHFGRFLEFWFGLVNIFDQIRNFFV